MTDHRAGPGPARNASPGPLVGAEGRGCTGMALTRPAEAWERGDELPLAQQQAILIMSRIERLTTLPPRLPGECGRGRAIVEKRCCKADVFINWPGPFLLQLTCSPCRAGIRSLGSLVVPEPAGRTRCPDRLARKVLANARRSSASGNRCADAGAESSGVERVVERVAWESHGFGCSGSTHVWHRCR